jgi:glycosyltransferase involved in cell wall biosynthesis
MKPFVSIVIPCRNEALSIRACLSSVLASKYPHDRMEVFVADGRSTDGTRTVLSEISKTDARLRTIDNPDLTAPRALNRAIAASRGVYILRVDAHSVIEPSYIASLVQFLEQHPEAWGAGGRMETRPETDGPFAAAITTVLSHRFGVGNSSFRTDGKSLDPIRVDTVFNCCWRREVFARVGIFHEQLSRSQDIEMSSRIAKAGGTLWLIPEARTTYFARVRFWSYLHHNWSNGVWSLVPAIYLGSLPVRWRHLVPLTFVVSLVASTAISVAEPRFRWLPLVPAIPYAIANLAASLATAWRARNLQLAVLLPPSFAGLHLAYGAGSLCGALRVLAHALRPGGSRTPAPILTSES